MGFTNQDVIEAYKALDVKPIRGVTSKSKNPNGAITHACAIGVIGRQRCGAWVNSSSVLMAKLGLTNHDTHFLNGFVDGFDSVVPDTFSMEFRPSYRDGHTRGAEVRTAVEAEFGPVPHFSEIK